MNVHSHASLFYAGIATRYLIKPDKKIVTSSYRDAMANKC